MKTDGKNIKLVGNHTKEYWITAAKQFIWPIDFNDMQILVPENDLELAENDLMVDHFRNNGWHIQSVIDVQYTTVYKKPEFTTKFREVVKVEEVKKTLYNIGEKYRVKSTDCELEITYMDKGKLHFKYLNRKKPDIISSEEQLTKVLRWQQWIKI